MKMAECVAVVTINWNAADMTRRCLESLRTTEGASWHLYIVDNASDDGSLDRLARDTQGASDVTLIRSTVNGGWTGGNNLGIARALADGCNAIFILNNDAFVRSDTLVQLLAVLRSQEGRTPVLGPVHMSAGSESYDFRIAHLEEKTGIPVWTRREDWGPETQRPTWPTAYVSGAGLFVDRAHLDAVGLFDDRFFLNFDDTDWCARAEAAGFPLLMVRDAVIDHVGSASIGGFKSPLQTYFLTRNRLLYAEKHRPVLDRLRLARRQWWRARELGRGHALRMLLPQRDPVAHAFRRGVLDYIMRRFGDCPPSVRAAQRQAASGSGS
jgi:GT2 family glycosyltransferase